MLNRNFANMVSAFGSSADFAKIKDINNTEQNALPSVVFTGLRSPVAKKISEMDYNTSTFTIGSGNSDETFESNALTTPIDETSFRIVSATLTKLYSNYEDTKSIITQLWEYTGSTPITINEIGLIVEQNGNIHIMLDRTVLDTPITVNSGDTFTIALTIGGKATVTVNKAA